MHRTHHAIKKEKKGTQPKHKDGAAQRRGGLYRPSAAAAQGRQHWPPAVARREPPAQTRRPQLCRHDMDAAVSPPPPAKLARYDLRQLRSSPSPGPAPRAMGVHAGASRKSRTARTDAASSTVKR